MLGVTQPALSMRLENARKGAEDLIKTPVLGVYRGRGQGVKEGSMG